MRQWRRLTREQLVAALDKLEDVGLVARTGGSYALGPPSLDEAGPALRKLTAKYGDLKGTDAFVLAVVPPILANGRSASIDTLETLVNMARWTAGLP